ncbi:Reverse transcriptase, RNA-dependent DNA polymerase domain containing hypothetical protein [Phytophthora palmivora]|uniref:Reverse transcriptase Ty1/copia-type domain-containing protein n=1 Tax=Phytophthora palmivora TaxID=4796 RepID=A0A2P4X4F8_9STRA|nr:Reverse transcriptase, RNA-dependent DNA polymerase domain containing hypothetical protein [Phytophthora palmivora]
MDNARSNNEFLQLTDGSNSVDNLPSLDDRDTSGHDSSDGEQNSKLPRMDDYEMVMTTMEVPRSYNEAMSLPELAKWKKGVRREIRSHIQNHTWDLIKRPRGIKVIGNKWVFVLKYDENGNITQYKSRHVALGYFQNHGIDYSHAYSSVASMNTIRVFLALFLTEFLKKMCPQGVRVPDGIVCKLRRSLYGLNPSAAVWFRTIRTVFMKVGFSRCRADPCLFVRHDHSDTPVFVVLYMTYLWVPRTKSRLKMFAVQSRLISQSKRLVM